MYGPFVVFGLIQHYYYIIIVIILVYIAEVECCFVGEPEIIIIL